MNRRNPANMRKMMGWLSNIRERIKNKKPYEDILEFVEKYEAKYPSFMIVSEIKEYLIKGIHNPYYIRDKIRQQILGISDDIKYERIEKETKKAIQEAIYKEYE